MTTQKRGRDDLAIARDSRKARARMASMRAPRLKVGAKAKSESAAKPRKRRKARANSESEESFVHEESSDDENGMADFIVDDDDEISEEDPSSGEEDMETFMSITGMKRTSIPPSRLRSDGGLAGRALKRARGEASTAANAAAGRGRSRRQPLGGSSSPSSSSEEDIVSPIPPRRNRGRVGAVVRRANAGGFVEEKKADYDSDSDLQILGTTTVTKTTAKACAPAKPPTSTSDGPTTSTFFGGGANVAKKTETDRTMDLTLSDDDGDANFGAALGKPSSRCSDSVASRRVLVDDDDDEDDDDSDSTDSLLDLDFRKKAKERSSEKNRSSSLDDNGGSDSFVDDDEAIATAMAMSLSESGKDGVRNYSSSADPGPPKKLLGQAKKKASQWKKVKKRRQSRVTVDLSPSSSRSPMVLEDDDGVTSDEDRLEEMLAEESESEEEEDDEADEYVDEEEREAGSVLKAANNLSSHVLRTMSNWVVGETGAVPKGMIVDGALAMTTTSLPGKSLSRTNGDRCGSTGSHEWISHEDMKLICPGVKLADYQLVGCNWLALLHGMKCSVSSAASLSKRGGKKGRDGGGMNVNGVLADEMGLGKTVQTICFLAWLKHRGKALGKPCLPHIIIVPASVLSNWMRELTKFCPSMNVVKYHGSLAEREDLKQDMRANYLGKGGLDIVLTTFSYFSKEKSDDRSFLKKFDFDYMVVDEAHQLKNPRGLRYKNMDKFTTSHRLLLTGTPVQNSPKELMALLCFLMPLFSRKGSRSFDESSENDGGERMLQHFVSLKQQEASSSENVYRKLKQLLAPFVLRRRKNECLKQLIPEKTRRLELVPFDKSSQKVYDSILASHIQAKQNGDIIDDASAKNNLFTKLRKAANHPLLLRTRHCSKEGIEHLVHHLHMYGYFGSVETATDKRELIRRELKTFSDFDIHGCAHDVICENPSRRDEMSRYLLNEEALFASPKFVRLKALLPDLIRNGHRMLIFSQWTRCLDLIGCLLDSMGLDFLRIDGQTAVAERQDLMDRYNESTKIPIMLLSTRAGGMGINLTGADTCILHDLDFNPFNDLQAEDRCHRIGQTKPVTVIKLVTEGTVDNDIYDMQERKAKMNAAILESGGEDKTKASAKKAAKKSDTAEVNNIIDNAVSRYFASPKEMKKTSRGHTIELDI